MDEDADLDPIRESQADLGGADPGKASQPGREGVGVDEEDGAIDGQGEGGPDLGGGQMAEAADTHLGGPEDGLGEDEEEEEDLPSQDGHLAEGPQPASYRGGTGPPGRGLRRSAPTGPGDGGGAHGVSPLKTNRESIAVCDRCLSLNRSIASSISRSTSFE